jgi:death-on-curing family protein
MEKMCHPIAVALFDSTIDPMTEFDDHERSLLESALNNPRQAFGGNDLYPTLSQKAAILYYSIIKNHPFKNGNKRTATASLLVFLHINGCWIRGDKDSQDYLVDIAKRVAKSLPAQREAITGELKAWLGDHMVSTSN